MTQKREENIPKFYFCIRAHTFSTHMPCPFKIYFTNKVNAICGGGQLLVTGSQGAITRVPGVRMSHVPGSQVPRPKVPVPESQGPTSQGLRVSGPRVSGLRVPGPRVSGSQGPKSQVSGSQVSGLRSWF